ncbi:isochorismatase family protein [Methylosarcina fibrata]|uniref:isochorismatase family protein n=1 Tax=Methylosarcina fibrata TaxID=105972 RepID=UPI00036579A5|nr:isochorismatase family protein [Methylosarcina fibrata]
MKEERDKTVKVVLQGGDGLLVADLQKDFCPGGRLAVAGGDQVVPVVNGYIECFIRHQLPVFATRCWHPEKHSSFISQGGPWPEHCVAGSTGAEFVDELHLPATAHILSKGTESGNDGYSAFSSPELKILLERMHVSRLFIGGLATDYCVLHSVCDALDLGYRVLLLTDAVRAINAKAQDGEKAIRQMISKGAQPVTLDRLQ